MSTYPQGSIVTAYIQSLSVLIRRTGNRMYRRKLSLSTTEWPILALLAREDALGISQICERLNRDKGHVSRDVASLYQRGLVQKRRDATDGRHVVIAFAPEAESERRAFLDIMRERSDKLVEGLTQEDLTNLKRILMIMNGNVRAMHAEEMRGAQPDALPGEVASPATGDDEASAKT